MVVMPTPILPGILNLDATPIWPAWTEAKAAQTTEAMGVNSSTRSAFSRGLDSYSMPLRGTTKQFDAWSASFGLGG